MKITIVMGFFLPMPPEAGGAVEKSWHRLAKELSQSGHQVTIISRQWRDWPAEEWIDGVRHQRLAGFQHTKHLWLNLLLDFIWSIRVHRRLPKGDVIVLNTISLASWLGFFGRNPGKIIVMLGRMPKGQFRLYRKPARIYVPSRPVLDAVSAERPSFAPLIRSIGYPIDWSDLSRKGTTPLLHDVVTIGFVGRINREKGLHLLCRELRHLSELKTRPWRAIICGPHDVAHGGSGAAYLAELRAIAPAQVEFLAPVYREEDLQALYRRFDIFCYPSLANQGETFGVAVAEAMAAGAVPVVSHLPCFQDFIEHGQSGIVFDPFATDSRSGLAEQLQELIENTATRQTLAAAAQKAVRRYDFGNLASYLAHDFAQLTTGSPSSSSSP